MASLPRNWLPCKINVTQVFILLCFVMVLVLNKTTSYCLLVVWLFHKIFALCRALQEQTMQLTGSLESANAEFSAVVAEKKKLASEAEEQKACEEGLRRLLRDRDKKTSDLQQAYDRKCQQLMDVVHYATVSDGHGWCCT